MTHLNLNAALSMVSLHELCAYIKVELQQSEHLISFGADGEPAYVTCLNNNRTGTYTLANPSNSKIQGLCSQLC
ncbi:hypothetical protein Leryth_003481 [Lithospermum erythrorhizon]|nr:hypothetical protein Leryth_003481 [Lithospermum erythrorhizon]